VTDPVRRPSLLFVDDEAGILNALRRICYEEEWDLHFAPDGEEGLRICRTVPVDLILSDFRMPGMDGVQFLKRSKAIAPDAVRLVLSGYADIKLVVQALNEGEIYRFLAKPWNDDDLIHNLRKALEHHRWQRESARLTAELTATTARLRGDVQELVKSLEERERELASALVERDEASWFVAAVARALGGASAEISLKSIGTLRLAPSDGGVLLYRASAARPAAPAPGDRS